MLAENLQKITRYQATNACLEAKLHLRNVLSVLKACEEITYGHCDVCPYLPILWYVQTILMKTLRVDCATHYILAYRYAKLKYI
jgi:hypothetical protein